MNIDEIIKLSKRIDSFGSIKLNAKYTPILDHFFDQDQFKTDSKFENSFSYNNYGVNSSTSVLWGITIKREHLIEPNILIDTAYYQIICGTLTVFQNQTLIKNFLNMIFKYSFSPSTNQVSSLLFENYIPKQGNHMQILHIPVSSIDNTGCARDIARHIADEYISRRRYSVMVFGIFNPLINYPIAGFPRIDPAIIALNTIRNLAYHINCYFLSLNMGGHIWSNLDLKNNIIPSQTSYVIPSICIYSNVIDTYQDAINGNSEDGFNKQVLCNKLDELEQTEGMLSIFACYCANSQELDEVAKQMDTPDISIKSFYREGRVDSELTIINPTHMKFQDKCSKKMIELKQL